MSAERRALPDFAAARADLEQCAAKREPRPDHDGDRVRIRHIEGAPSSLSILVTVRDANADGWLLDKHTDHGQELVFVPVEGGVGGVGGVGGEDDESAGRGEGR